MLEIKNPNKKARKAYNSKQRLEMPKPSVTFANKGQKRDNNKMKKLMREYTY